MIQFLLPVLGLLWAGVAAAASLSMTAVIGAEMPGPSTALFATPYYSCKTNYYVAPNGLDSNPGTSTSPWATLQHANGSGGPGVCVNVVPGSYAWGADITNGGNLASSTGYMVYRCQTLDGCTITDAGSHNNAAFDVQANYVMIDGFNLAASSALLYGQGVEVSNGVSAYKFAQHHVWVVNSIIQGYGQSGLQLNNGEYLYAIHNRIFDNASAGCAAQGSGISYAVEIPIPSYTTTADDINNSIVGPIGSSFHNAVMWNVLYNNALTTCGSASHPYDTDGNNIIFDTWAWTQGNGPIDGGKPYTNGGLIAFNIVYNAGGGGVHLFYSGGITAANNTCYNSFLDPYDNGSYRPCMDSVSFSGTNTLINNIIVAIPAVPSTGIGGNCQYSTVPYAQFNIAIAGAPPTGQPGDTFNHNVSQIRANASCFGNDFVGYQADAGQYSCSNNKCATDPLWVNVGTTSVGTENMPPDGTNFALMSSAPEIGYGLTEPYLSPQSVDAGACYHTLTTCP